MKTIKRLAVSTIGLLTALGAHSEVEILKESGEGESLLAFDVEARLDAQIVSDKGKINDSQTGFMGKYIAVKAEGTIATGFSYVWRQRFSRTPKDHTFWDQTDLLELTYTAGKFDVGAGKQAVMIGGFEYNRPPIDLMCPNLYVTNVACYQFGIKGGYRLTENDHLGVQISQSPFANADNRNLYAFSLMWQGEHELGERLRLGTLWSVNEVAYEKGKYSNYVALGNRLVLDDRFSLTADIMIRTYPYNNAFKNNTFMLEGAWDITSQWRISGKVSYDCNLGVNLTENAEVARGSQIAIGGGVIEWFPLRRRRNLLRLHAGCFYSKGTNMNATDLMQKNTLYGTVGLTWHMNLLKIKK